MPKDKATMKVFISGEGHVGMKAWEKENTTIRNWYTHKQTSTDERVMCRLPTCPLNLRYVVFGSFGDEEVESVICVSIYVFILSTLGY